MAKVTYRDLARFIANMTDEQKDCDVTIFASTDGEFFPLVDVDDNDMFYPMCESDDDNDVLDVGHPYLTI